MSPGAPTLLLHHNGEIVEREDDTLPVRGNAIRWGLIVFEGVRVYRTFDAGLQPWLLDEHLARLQRSCSSAGLDPAICDRVAPAIAELLAAAGLTDDCYLLLTISAGNSRAPGTAYSSVLTVSVAATGHERWLVTGEGMALTVRNLRGAGNPEMSAFARGQLLLAQAQAEGFDECAIVDDSGRVSRSASAGLFLVEDGVLIVPESANPPGIMGSWLASTAPQIGVAVRTEPVDRERLQAAQEVFTCGTGVEFGCVRSVDGVELSHWPRFPITTALSDEMFRRARSGGGSLSGSAYVAATSRRAGR